MKRRKLFVGALAVLLGVAILASATFAWFTARQSVENEFKTANTDNVIIVEEFDPPTEWMPGTTVDKKVLVAQTGTGSVVVRVQLTELLSMLETDGNGSLKVYRDMVDTADLADGAIAVSTSETAIEAIEESLGGTWYAVPANELSAAAQSINGLVVRSNGSKVVAYYVNPSDSADVRQVNIVKSQTEGQENELAFATFEFPYYKKAADKTAVHGVTPEDIDHDMIQINFSANAMQSLTGWSGASENWYYGGDGYYYYGAVLHTGEATKLLLESVQLNEDAGDAYKNIEYRLTVNMEAVQAMQDAVLSDWKGTHESFALANPAVWAILEGMLEA